LHPAHRLTLGPVLEANKPEVADSLSVGNRAAVRRTPDQLRIGQQVVFENATKSETIFGFHSLSARQVEMVLAGGLINLVKRAIPEQPVHL
jgi:hypothetical protein